LESSSPPCARLHQAIAFQVVIFDARLMIAQLADHIVATVDGSPPKKYRTASAWRAGLRDAFALVRGNQTGRQIRSVSGFGSSLIWIKMGSEIAQANIRTRSRAGQCCPCHDPENHVLGRVVRKKCARWGAASSRSCAATQSPHRTPPAEGETASASARGSDACRFPKPSASQIMLRV